MTSNKSSNREWKRKQFKNIPHRRRGRRKKNESLKLQTQGNGMYCKILEPGRFRRLEISPDLLNLTKEHNVPRFQLSHKLTHKFWRSRPIKSAYALEKEFETYTNSNAHLYTHIHIPTHTHTPTHSKREKRERGGDNFNVLHHLQRVPSLKTNTTWCFRTL